MYTFLTNEAKKIVHHALILSKRNGSISLLDTIQVRVFGKSGKIYQAIALFQVAGADAALKYIEGLPILRFWQQPKATEINNVFTHNDGCNN